tara:strand:- start:4538 stop:4954 length:417 start_codon:yes stop_codon:yes gene_type:complete
MVLCKENYVFINSKRQVPLDVIFHIGIYLPNPTIESRDILLKAILNYQLIEIIFKEENLNRSIDNTQKRGQQMRLSTEDSLDLMEDLCELYYDLKMLKNIKKEISNNINLENMLYFSHPNCSILGFKTNRWQHRCRYF